MYPLFSPHFSGPCYGPRTVPAVFRGLIPRFFQHPRIGWHFPRVFILLDYLGYLSLHFWCLPPWARIFRERWGRKISGQFPAFFGALLRRSPRRRIFVPWTLNISSDFVPWFPPLAGGGYVLFTNNKHKNTAFPPLRWPPPSPGLITKYIHAPTTNVFMVCQMRSQKQKISISIRPPPPSSYSANSWIELSRPLYIPSAWVCL